MKIRSIECHPFRPKFYGGGYAMSFVRMFEIPHRLASVVLDNGQCSMGEIVRWPTYMVDDLDAIEDAELRRAEGLDLADLPALIAEWQIGGMHLRGLAYAIDTIFHDLVARAAGISLASLLGGPAGGTVGEYLSLSCEAPTEMAKIVRARGWDFSVIQAKVGSDTIGQDIERIHAVLSEMRDDQILLADFNGALTADTALASLRAITDSRVMWEEPCNTYDENLRVARGLNLPVMCDQSLVGLETYIRLIKDGVVAAAVIKLATLGGISVARTIRDLLIAARVRMRIDGPWCGEIGASPALHLSLGVPPDLLMASIDLTEVLDTPRDLIHHPQPGRVGPVSGPGLGSPAIIRSN